MEDELAMEGGGINESVMCRLGVPPKKWTPEISVEYSLRGCLSWRIEPIENIVSSLN